MTLKVLHKIEIIGMGIKMGRGKGNNRKDRKDKITSTERDKKKVKEALKKKDEDKIF